MAVPSDNHRPTRIVLFAALIVALIVAALLLVERLERYDLRESPLAYDWEILWDATEGGHVQWDAGMFSPPWAVIFVLPLSWLSLNTSWAIMTLLSLAVLVLSVPRYAHWQHHLLGVALLFTSYSYRRYFVDTNYEAISILPSRPWVGRGAGLSSSLWPMISTTAESRSCWCWLRRCTLQTMPRLHAASDHYRGAVSPCRCCGPGVATR